jgi:hypothetical protein
MKKFQLNKQKLNLKTLTTPLLALSLMAGCAGLFGGSVSAASITASSDLTVAPPSLSDIAFPPLSVGSAPNGGDFVLSVGDVQYIGRKFTISSVCSTATLESILVQYNASRLNDSISDGVLTYATINGSTSVPLLTAAAGGTFTNNPNVTGIGNPAGMLSTPTGSQTGTVNATFDLTGFTGADLPNLTVMQVIDNNDSGSPNEYTSSSPQITITYDDSSCPSTNTIPTITSPSAVTIPSTTTSGSTVVPDSSLAATDTDGDTLTYSITAGNANSYFAIDSNTGNITTTQTNIPAGTYTITVQVDDGNGGTATATVTITVTASVAPALYCPSPYSTTTLLTPSGDCDEDGITNQTEGFDPDMDSNPNTGTAPIDTDSDSIPDYLDLDSDNDGILDTEEKGTLTNSSTNPSDVDSDGTPDFRDLDSDNDSTKDVLESGRNFIDTNNDGRIDGTTNTYGIPSSAVSTTNPKALASTSLKDSDNNGTPDYRQSSRNGAGVLAKTGESTITALALATLSLVGAVLAKARRVRV